MSFPLPAWIDPPLWIHPDQTVLAALTEMLQTGIPMACCPLPGGFACLSQGDVLALAATGVGLGAVSVATAVVAPPLILEEIGDPESLLRHLQEAGIDQAPVVMAGQLVGVVSRPRVLHYCWEQGQARLRSYQELLDRSPEIIERFDREFRHVYVNAELERVTGIPAAAMLNHSCRSLGLETSMVERWEGAARTLLATGSPQTIEFVTPTLQGERWYAMTMVPERDPQGQIQGILCFSHDITARKTTETFTQTLIDLLPDLLLHLDRQGTYLRFHACGSQMRILHPEALTQAGMGLADVHDPETLSLWMSQIAQALDSGELQTFVQCLSFDGRTQYEEVRLVPFDADSVIAIVRDLTPYHQTQQALSESEARFRDLVTNVPGVVFQYLQHREGHNRLIYMSPGCWKLWEVSAAEVERDSSVLWQMVLPEDVPGMAASVQRSMADLSPWEWIWRMVTPSGTVKWLHGYGQPRRLSPDETLWNSLIVDVTETMQAKQALEASQAQLTSILNAVNGVIKRYFLDEHLDWHYEYISHNAEGVLGFSALELLQAPQLWVSRVPEADLDTVWKPALLRLQQERQVQVEFRFRHKNRHWLWIQATLSSEWDPDRQGWQITCLELDITERKYAEERLREQQAQLDLVVQTSNVGFYISDLLSQTSYVSPAYKAQLGYKPGDPEASPADWQQRLHPEDRDLAIAAYRQFREQGHPYSLDFRLRHRDGTYRWIHSDATLLRDPQGRPVKVIGTHQDITERKQTELTLQHRLQQARFLNQLVQSIQAEANLLAIFAWVTTGLGSLLGVDQVSISQYLREERVWHYLSEDRRHDGVTPTLGLRIPDANNVIAATLHQGKIFRIDLTTDSTLDPNNHRLHLDYPGAWLIVPILVQGTLWGAITLRQANPQWWWHEEHLDLIQQVVNHVSLALQQLQLIEQLQSLNSELHYQVEIRNAELQKLLRHEQLSRHLTEEIRSRLHEDEVLQITVNRLAETLDLYGCLIAIRLSDSEYEFRYQSEHFPIPLVGTQWTVNRDPLQQILRGQTLYFCTNHPLWGPSTDVVTPIRDDNDVLGFLRLFRRPKQDFLPMEIAMAEEVASQCAIGIRQARLFQKIEHQVAELQQINFMKDEFLHMVSHELRTPLASMKMALHMLEVNPDPHAQKRYREILRAEWNRELNLVNELLELQALESGTRGLQATKLVIATWIQGLVPVFELRCHERSQRFHCSLDLAQPVMTTDHILLERIILELLNNACKYTPPQETISLQVTSTTDHVEFRVINTGVTIPPDQLSKIFEKFHRIPSLDRYNQGGTGLGLALVQKAVWTLAGQIHVSSTQDQTDFQVLLPLDLPPRSA